MAQLAVADCFAQMGGLDLSAARRIGNGARHLEHLAVGPGG